MVTTESKRVGNNVLSSVLMLWDLTPRERKEQPVKTASGWTFSIPLAPGECRLKCSPVVDNTQPTPKPPDPLTQKCPGWSSSGYPALERFELLQTMLILEPGPD